MTILEAQRTIDRWIKSYGVRYFNELTNMTLLTEEVGELARLVGRAYGEQSFKTPRTPEEIRTAIADEMADVAFVLICLANQMEIDLEAAIAKNLQKKTQRDKDRHQQNPKLNKP